MEEKIKSILESQNPWWFDKRFEKGINRLNNYNKLLDYLKLKEILFLIGVRRCGKSTLMYQLIDKLLKNHSANQILFINLDEPYFMSQRENSQLIKGIVEDYLLENKVNKLYLFIDEVQNYSFWSETLKYLYDINRNIKIIASGSSSNIIESKLSIKLSGRYFYQIISPLSFKEFLNFNNKNKLEIKEYKNSFEKYLLFGGFPRVVLEKNVEIKKEILINYFQTIYSKDIILPNNIRNSQDIYDLLYYLISNNSKFYSYNSISKVLEISVDTIKEYINYSVDSYLLFNLYKYDKSIKKQLRNDKKIYSIDTGLTNAISFKFSEDKGRLLENLVFIELKKRNKEIYYHKDNYECDFVIKKGLKITHAIQVTKSLANPDTRKREIKGLLDALKTYNLSQGLILTEDEAQEFEVEGYKIIVKPIWKWLLHSAKGD